MAKPIMNETQAEQNLAEPRVECNVKFEFDEELLTELQNNTFSGRCEEDVIGHIGKILVILDLVKIAGVDPFQISMKAFPLSLSKDARKWWMNEGNENITTWEELVKKFYPLSCASNYDKMCDDEIGNEEGLLNDEVSSDKEWKEHEYRNPPNDSFPKPYLNINHKKDKNHHNEKNRDTDKLSGLGVSRVDFSCEALLVGTSLEEIISLDEEEEFTSFQDDEKYEHDGQETRSQDGKDDKDKQGKDLKISELKTKSKDNDKSSRSKITQHEGTRLQQDKDQDNKSRTQTTKQSQETQDRKHESLESSGNLASGEIVRLKLLSQTRNRDFYLVNVVIG
ncbi:hypothetical protein Tco_0270508 [Tanacetum coccineum]